MLIALLQRDVSLQSGKKSFWSFVQSIEKHREQEMTQKCLKTRRNREPSCIQQVTSQKNSFKVRETQLYQLPSTPFHSSDTIIRALPFSLLLLLLLSDTGLAPYPESDYCLVFSLYAIKVYTTYTFSHVYRMLLNKVYMCRLHLLLFFFLTSAFFLFTPPNLYLPQRKKDLVVIVLLHHHTATELLLCGQTRVLLVRVCAGGRVRAPRPWLGHDEEGALCCRLGLLLEADVGGRGGLLADVQTSLKEVSSGGHGGQRRGVAG